MNKPPLHPSPADVVTVAGDNPDLDVAAMAALVRRGRTFIVVHRACGHILANPPTRADAAGVIDAAPVEIRNHLRVRTATAVDLMAVLKAERCPLCATDGRITESAAR